MQTIYSPKRCAARISKYIAIHLIGNTSIRSKTPEQMPNFVTEKMRAQKE